MLYEVITQNNENFNKIIANAANISDTIAKANISKTLSHLNQAVDGLSAIVTKVESGEGTMGELVNNKKMYNELEASSKELKLLLEDMRLV